jgi:hypothetical protein
VSRRACLLLRLHAIAALLGLTVAELLELDGAEVMRRRARRFS